MVKEIMNKKIQATYAAQKIDNYHVIAISEEIYKTLRLQNNQFQLIVNQDKVVLEGQRIHTSPSSSTTDKEADTSVL